MQKSDLVVIGGGPGGYVAALRAAHLGMRVTLCEKTHLGGVCLNWGCIPTKALLRSAEMLDFARHFEVFGLKGGGDVTPDLKAMVQRSRTISGQLAGGVKHLLKKRGVQVIEGHARLSEKTGSEWSVSVQNEEGEDTLVGAPHVLLATGARARMLPQDFCALTPDVKGPLWTAREAMTPDSVPESLLIIGSGAIGSEFASFYAALGSKVTLVEMQPQILPQEDREIAVLARKQFEKRGIRILTDVRVEKIEKADGGAKVEFTGAATDDLEGDQVYQKVLLAIGIIGNTEDLGLEKAGVQVEKGHIVTHDFSQTSSSGIFAIGDVTGPPWLAHKASHEGILCVEYLAGRDVHPLDVTKIPGCTYTFPQVASIGLTQEKAQEQGLPLKIGRFPLQANGKALALGESAGMAKVITHAETGEILGAHLCGPEVTELIGTFSLARHLEALDEDITASVFPHPTLSEILPEAVLAGQGSPLHI